MAGFAAGNADTSCAFFESEIILGDPSSSKNSCTGGQGDVQAKMGASGKDVCRSESAEVRPISPIVNMFRPDEDEVDLDDDAAGFLHSETKGWTKLLQDIPSFTHQKLENKMVNNSRTMPDNVAPKAHRNLKKGYGLWKEGYVNNVQVKANVQCKIQLFLVKARVSASMKSVSYPVYVQLDQKSGEVEYAKCTCKAGQGGCCKHVAALLYTLLDFVNLSLSMIPEDLTCTQVAQKWSIPSGCSKTLNKAVKFDELLFQKAQYNKTNKRLHSSTVREKYCSTPPYAQAITKDDIQSMTNVLREAERASLLCDTLESNNYEPCDMFETSCAKAKRTMSKLDLETVEPNTDKLLVDNVFTSVPCEFDQTVKLGLDEKKLMETLVYVTPEQAKDICLKTIDQSSSAQWYVERSVRITASVFGKVMNRRKTVEPNSIVKTITEKTKCHSSHMPVSLQWGIENESKAVEKYKNLGDKENLEVKSCGLVISPRWPWLGCSPDGIVVEDGKVVGCVEIKCPYSKKDMTLLDAANGDKRFFLKNTTSGLKLKDKHEYFYQCQGTMNILGLPWLDFVIYTNTDIHVQRLHRDINLWERKMVPELTDFYCSFILPILAPK